MILGGIPHSLDRLAMAVDGRASICCQQPGHAAYVDLVPAVHTFRREILQTLIREFVQARVWPPVSRPMALSAHLRNSYR